MGKMKRLFLFLFAGLILTAFAPKAANAAAKFVYNGYSEGYGFTVVITDPSGKELKPGDKFNAGTELTATFTLDDMFEWDDNAYFYAGDSYYIEGDSCTFTPYDDFWVSAYPVVKYNATLKADSHVKSFEFINAAEESVYDAGLKDYLFDKSMGLSGSSIAVRCIFEDGYELDTAVVTSSETGASIIRYSENNIFDIYFDYRNATLTPSVIKITSRKETSRKLSGKLTTIKPTVKKYKGEYDNEIDYVISLGKGKKASTFNYVTYDYGLEVNTYLTDYNIRSSAQKYEVIDLSEASKLNDETIISLVNCIYHLYRMDKFPNLKAIYLPKGLYVPTTEQWTEEFIYYPVKVITLK